MHIVKMSNRSIQSWTRDGQAIMDFNSHQFSSTSPFIITSKVDETNLANSSGSISKLKSAIADPASAAELATISSSPPMTSG